MTLTRRNALALGAGLTLAAPSLALAQAREMRLGILTPPGHPWNLTALRFGEQLKAATNNRLSLTVFHAGQLGSEAAMLQQMQSGALDMGWIMAAELGSRVPAIAAITAPWVVRTTAQVGQFVKTPVATGLFDLLPRETGTIGLGWGITGMRVMFSTKDISSLGEVRGLKIRTIPSPTFRDFYTALGAAPTPIPTPAVFDAMTNGQVDGLEADLAFSWNQRFDRVSKVMLGMNAQFMPVAALVSGRVWAALPAADKEIITRLIKSNLDQQIAELVAEEPGIIANFRNAPIPLRPVAAGDTDAAVRAFDQIWLERAPVLREMRRVGASMA